MCCGGSGLGKRFAYFVLQVRNEIFLRRNDHGQKRVILFGLVIAPIKATLPSFTFSMAEYNQDLGQPILLKGSGTDNSTRRKIL